MWLNDRPTTPGFYWCHQRGKTRIVHIWRYKNGTELFTNEDSGASIKDTLYDGTQWMAVVIPPNPQDQNESAQPAPNFADAYQGAMEEVAIWKKRALEAEDLNRKFIAEINGPMHMGEPAQPAPSDEYVGWYCAHCERGVDASEVTYHEQHQACGRVITDDRPPKASGSVTEGWLRAIDEALVVTHLGVANASDTYEQAKAKLDSLIGFHVDVATDPAVNGGWKLMLAAAPKPGKS